MCDKTYRYNIRFVLPDTDKSNLTSSPHTVSQLYVRSKTPSFKTKELKRFLSYVKKKTF